MPASQAAKVKTTLQLLAITLYILPLGGGADDVKLTVLVAALVLTVVTGVQYVLKAAAPAADIEPPRRQPQAP